MRFVILLFATMQIGCSAPLPATSIALFAHASGGGTVRSITSSDAEGPTCAAGDLAGAYDTIWGAARAEARDTDAFLLCLLQGHITYAATIASPEDDVAWLDARPDGTLVAVLRTAAGAVTPFGPVTEAVNLVGVIDTDGAPSWSRAYARGTVTIVDFAVSDAEIVAVVDVESVLVFADTELREGPAVLVWDADGNELHAFRVRSFGETLGSLYRARQVALGATGYAVVVGFTVADDYAELAFGVDRNGATIWQGSMAGDSVSDLAMIDDGLYMGGYDVRAGEQLGFVTRFWADDGTRDRSLPTSLRVARRLAAGSDGSLAYAGVPSELTSGSASVLGLCDESTCNVHTSFRSSGGFYLDAVANPGDGSVTFGGSFTGHSDQFDVASGPSRAFYIGRTYR